MRRGRVYSFVRSGSTKPFPFLSIRVKLCDQGSVQVLSVQSFNSQHVLITLWLDQLEHYHRRDRKSIRLEHANMEPIAIVGFSFKLPQEAEDTHSFWQMLKEGRNVKTDWPESRINIEAFHDPSPKKAHTVSSYQRMSMLKAKKPQAPGERGPFPEARSGGFRCTVLLYHQQRGGCHGPPAAPPARDLVQSAREWYDVQNLRAW